MSICILPYAPRRSKGKGMFIKCLCGRCSQCRRREANRKYYAARRLDAGPGRERWSRIYDLKFQDPTYYEPIISSPQSAFDAVVELMIGRGRSGYVTPAGHGPDR